jgi:hypothetical protein
MNMNGRELLEAVQRDQERKDRERAAAERVHRESAENGRVQRLPPHEPPAIHYAELPEGSANSPIACEWQRYRREVGRLLAEGHENQWVLIKGEEIVGIWDTEEDARAVALQQYLNQPCLIHQVRGREPIVRMSAVTAP